MTELDEYWETFLERTGRDKEERCSGDLFFEAKGFVGDELVSLVLSGKKTAFFSSYSTYLIDQEPVPVSGDHNRHSTGTHQRDISRAERLPW